MRPLLILLSIGSVLLGLCAPPTATAAPTTASGGDLARASTASLKERDVITLVNRARDRKGCKALRTLSSLQTASGRHTSRMARAHRLSHRLPGEPTLRKRISTAGFTGARMLGEVIAGGSTTPSATVKRWLNSPAHRALLLDCRFRAAGAGYATGADGSRWWTVDLGRR